MTKTITKHQLRFLQTHSWRVNRDAGHRNLKKKKIEEKETNFIFCSNFKYAMDEALLAGALTIDKFKGLDNEGHPIFKALDAIDSVRKGEQVERKTLEGDDDDG